MRADHHFGPGVGNETDQAVRHPGDAGGKILARVGSIRRFASTDSGVRLLHRHRTDRRVFRRRRSASVVAGGEPTAQSAARHTHQQSADSPSYRARTCARVWTRSSSTARTPQRLSVSGRPYWVASPLTAPTTGRTSNLLASRSCHSNPWPRPRPSRTGCTSTSKWTPVTSPLQ